MTPTRTILVTGGNRGIGFAIAAQCVSAGHNVAVTARSGAGPDGSLTVHADVTDGESLDRAIAQVEEKL
ncbi:MAG: SDR family NAD(P)-dependent oxidoreductase, partial [Pontimonas sp.]